MARVAWLPCSRSLVLREAGFRGSAWFSVQQDFEVDETEPGGICHIVVGTNLSFLFHARVTIIGLLERDLMSTIHKQLVTDEEGRPVGVLIPYEEWLRIEQQLGGAAGANGLEQLRRHEGMIRLSEDPVAYQRRLRDEWA